MRPAQRARQRLKGRWLTAVAVQCTRLGAGLLVLLAELFALRLLDLGTDRAVDASALWQGGWLYGVVLLGTLLLDWLLVSPLYCSLFSGGDTSGHCAGGWGCFSVDWGGGPSVMPRRP